MIIWQFGVKSWRMEAGQRLVLREKTAKIIPHPEPTKGAIAQLGERIVRNDEVVGSIPTSSTK